MTNSQVDLLKYRARVKNSNKYIIGWFFKTSKASYIIPIASYFTYIEIDESTLAVNRSDMIDSQGKEIFASLNPSGLGGDIDTTYYENEHVFIFDTQETIPYWSSWDSWTVSGIKEI